MILCKNSSGHLSTYTLLFFITVSQSPVDMTTPNIPVVNTSSELHEMSTATTIGQLVAQQNKNMVGL